MQIKARRCLAEAEEDGNQEKSLPASSLLFLPPYRHPQTLSLPAQAGSIRHPVSTRISSAATTDGLSQGPLKLLLHAAPEGCFQSRAVTEHLPHPPLPTRHRPAFCASPWGFSKPASSLASCHIESCQGFHSIIPVTHAYHRVNTPQILAVSFSMTKETPLTLADFLFSVFLVKNKTCIQSPGSIQGSTTWPKVFLFRGTERRARPQLCVSVTESRNPMAKGKQGWFKSILKKGPKDKTRVSLMLNLL